MTATGKAFVDSWNKLANLGLQAASAHPYIACGLFVGAVLLVWDVVHEEMGAIRLVSGLFILLSTLWLFSTNDMHHMLLAVATIIAELTFAISNEVEFSVDRRLASAIEEVKGMRKEFEELRENIENIENEVSSQGRR
jgi:hypothetical protein